MWSETSSGSSSSLRGGRADEARARRPVDVLHRHVELAVVLAEVEHLHDVRVPQAGAHPRLVDEHRGEVGVARELREDALDRDDLLEPVRARPRRARYTSAIPPVAMRCKQLVRAESGRHRLGGGAHRASNEA